VGWFKDLWVFAGKFAKEIIIKKVVVILANE
jgi:hypothetical protein